MSTPKTRAEIDNEIYEYLKKLECDERNFEKLNEFIRYRDICLSEPTNKNQVLRRIAYQQLRLLVESQTAKFHLPIKVHDDFVQLLNDAIDPERV